MEESVDANVTKCIVAYIDVGGSGIETVSHLKENQRITFMFNGKKKKES